MSFSFCCCPADVTVISNVAQTLKYPAIEEPSSVHICNHVSVNKRDISTIININKKRKRGLSSSLTWLLLFSSKWC